jgi:ABC-type transport system substrate-binding protein
MNRRKFIGVSAAGMAALAANATRSRAHAQTVPQYPDWIAASTKPAKKGGAIARASAWDPPVLDPRHTQSVGLYQFAGLVHNRLVRYAFTDEAGSPNDMTLKGDLAESWETSKDYRQWTFKIRKGVKWQNLPPVKGREFTSADIKYCYEQYAKEGVQAFTFQEIEGMETPDKHTIRIHLKSPNTLFAHNMAEPISVVFAKEVLEEDGDLKKRVIGTGPYMLKEHTRKVRVVLERNPDYYDSGRPYADQYTILSTPDDATRKAAFRTGQSDIIWMASPSEMETLRKTNPQSQFHAYHNTLAPFGLALSQDKPPYNDVRVRRAISMAIDRQKQVDTVYEGHGILGWGVPWIYVQETRPTAKDLGPYWKYDPTAAKKLMAEAGQSKGFETTLFYYEYFPQMSSQVQLVQQELKKNLNIDIKIQKLDYTTYYGRYVEGKWEGMCWGFQSGHAIGLDERTYAYMHSKSTKNFFRVNDPQMDEMVTRLRQTPDAAAQRALTKKIVDREYDQVLRMWMPYDNGFMMVQPHVRNASSRALRRTDGYGSPTIARIWLDK